MMPNNLEEKYAATESKEIKQELYSQSFVMIQRLEINSLSVICSTDNKNLP